MTTIGRSVSGGADQGARGEADTARVLGIQCWIKSPFVQANPLPLLTQVLKQASKVFLRSNGGLVCGAQLIGCPSCLESEAVEEQQVR
eukprot:1797459-Rhodomonas_salina.1